MSGASIGLPDTDNSRQMRVPERSVVDLF